MTLEEAIALINNLDFKETHRRYAPQHGLLLFDRTGQVVAVYRYKETPDESEQCRTIKQHGGCVQISTWPGLYATAGALRKRIDQSMDVFALMKPEARATETVDAQVKDDGGAGRSEGLVQGLRDLQVNGVVALSVEQTVRLYCHLRACERSLFSLEEGLWVQFMDYFSAKEMAGIRRFVEHLHGWIFAPAADEGAGVLGLLWGRVVPRLSGRTPDRCCFRRSLLYASEKVLRRFMELWFVRVQPSRADVVALSQEFAGVRSRVESGCGILRWLPVANEVDSFYKTLSLPSYSIAEILERLQQPPDGSA
jgi:hypothetical protein